MYTDVHTVRPSTSKEDIAAMRFGPIMEIGNHEQNGSTEACDKIIDELRIWSLRITPSDQRMQPRAASARTRSSWFPGWSAKAFSSGRGIHILSIPPRETCGLSAGRSPSGTSRSTGGRQSGGPRKKQRTRTPRPRDFTTGVGGLPPGMSRFTRTIMRAG